MLPLRTVCFFISMQVINGEIYAQHLNRPSLNARKWHESRRRNIPQNYLTNNRQSRFLSLFTFVQFNNQQCVTASGESGTCLAAEECNQRSGIANGPCAGGYGVCCIFFVRCGTTTRENGTYFVQDGYPAPFDGTTSCQLTIMKQNANVCQYRLDFDQLVLMGPENQNNLCTTDQFLVSGSTPVPMICGLNSGNHIYVDAGAGSTNAITLSVVTSGASFNRNWKIRINQIPCYTSYKADDGCLQYFTGITGEIRSFNYDPATGLQLSNQDYGICIRTERNFCSIQYTQCPDPVNNRSQSFTLTGNTNNPTPAIVGSTGVANFCQADYIIIPMVSNVGRPPTGPFTTVDRICGGTLAADMTLNPTPIRSTLKPFRVWFHSDNVEAPADFGNRGFCLNYVQQPCTNNLS